MGDKQTISSLVTGGEETASQINNFKGYEEQFKYDGVYDLVDKTQKCSWN